MPLSPFEFLRICAGHGPLTTVCLLVTFVLLVNGWTDAPNAIAPAVGTGALSFRRGVLLAAVCNFLGVLCVTAVNTSVAQTVYSVAQFSGGSRGALITLCAAMTAIVLWAVCAWYFGIPTSESHALVAGISGAAVALEGSFSCIRWDSWGKVLAGLALSTALGFWAGRAALLRVKGLGWTSEALRLAQIPGAAFTAFFHGAQDGQKFLGVFLLAAALAQGRQDADTFWVPLWMMLFCALCMAGGTALGGRRIINKVARDMVTLTPQTGLASDLAGCGCLLAATALGLPVSTTHTRTAALLGAGTGDGRRADRAVVRSIVLAWLLTFPGCFCVGYGTARFFLWRFI